MTEFRYVVAKDVRGVFGNEPKTVRTSATLEGAEAWARKRVRQDGQPLAITRQQVKISMASEYHPWLKIGRVSLDGLGRVWLDVHPSACSLL